MQTRMMGTSRALYIAPSFGQVQSSSGIAGPSGLVMN